MSTLREPTDAEVADACMWLRHDFGLMDEDERTELMFMAREWRRAWIKAGAVLATAETPAREPDGWIDPSELDYLRRGTPDSWTLATIWSHRTENSATVPVWIGTPPDVPAATPAGYQQPEDGSDSIDSEPFDHETFRLITGAAATPEQEGADNGT